MALCCVLYLYLLFAKILRRPSETSKVPKMIANEDQISIDSSTGHLDRLHLLICCVGHFFLSKDREHALRAELAGAAAGKMK